MRYFLTVLTTTLMAWHSHAQVAMIILDDIPGNMKVCVTNYGPTIAAAELSIGVVSGRVSAIEGQVIKWNTAYGWGDHHQQGYATTQDVAKAIADIPPVVIPDETDPVFTAWDKSTGISIKENQISDLKNYLTLETLPVVEIPDEKDPRAMRLYHYGDPDIVITPTNFFGFNPTTGTITSYSSSGPIDVVIPYEIGGVPVVAIGDNAFESDPRVTKITSPRTLTSIGNNSFQESSLTTLTAPALTSIGNSAFAGSLLTTLTAHALTSIGDYALSGIPLTTLTAPALTSIGDSAFDGSSLTTLTAHALTSIGYYGLSRSSLTTLIAPALTSIAEGAFYGTSLTTLTAPALTSIGDHAFTYCSTLTSVYYGSDKPMEGEGIYDGTPANLVNYVTNPTATGWGATFGGRPVVRLDLHGGAFHGSGAALTGVTKPVDIADRPTFAQVTNVVDAYTETDPVFAAWLDTNPLNGFLTEEQDLAALRLYHYGDTDIVESPADWFVFDGAGTITGYNYVAGREDVVIPWEIGGVPVVAIGDNAFNGISITSIKGAGNVVTVGDSAFIYCTSLTSIDFPAVTSIGNYAFYYCYSLTSIDFPAVTSIGDYAFYNCYSLTSIEFPAVTSIRDYAFGSCLSLTNITTAANAPTVGSSAFSITPANLVITVTDPQATGWGATFGGRPVVRLDLHADAVYSGGSLVVTEKTKELHNDSYTNLVWRNVFSNGWVWLVAYTNTPTGGQ